MGNTPNVPLQALDNSATAPPTASTPVAPASATSNTPVSVPYLQSPSPSSFADRLATEANKIGVLPGANGWAKSLIAATMNALTPRETASAGPTVATTPATQQTQAASPQSGAPQQTTGGKIISGVGQVAGGLAHALNDVTDNLGLTNIAANRRQEMLDRANMAKANSEMIYQEALTHQLNEKDAADNIASGQKALNAMLNQQEPGKLLRADVTSADINTMIQKHQFDPTTDTAFPTNQRVVGTDKNGKPIMQTTYSLVTPPKTHTVNDADVAILKNAPGYQSITAGTVLPGSSYNAAYQTAQNIETVKRKTQFDLDKAQAEDLDAKAKIDQNEALQHLDGLSRVFVGTGGNIEGAIKYITGEHQIPEVVNGKPTGKMIPDPLSVQYAQDHPNAQFDFQTIYGGPEKLQSSIDAQNKQIETDRHNREDERLRQLEINTKDQDAKYKDDLGVQSQLGKISQSDVKDLRKKADDYSKFLFSAKSAQASIQNAKNGDELANSLGPLQTALLVTSANGVHRINTTEVDAAGPKVGSAGRRLDALLQKAGTGQLPEGTLAEMSNLINLYTQTKYQSYLQDAAYINPSPETRVYDMNGGITTLGQAQQRMAAALNPTAQSTAPAPNSHVFDAARWQQANPGKDVNAAISAATAQGFQVKQ